MAGKWVYDGSSWQPANAPASTPANQVVTFTSSQNVTPPAGARFGFLEMLGGGAGSDANYGGDAGNFFAHLVVVSSLTWPQSLAVGAGGAAGGTAASGTGGTTSLGNYHANGGRRISTSMNLFDRSPGWQSEGGNGGNPSSSMQLSSEYGGSGGKGPASSGPGLGFTKSAAIGALSGYGNGANASAGGLVGQAGAARITWIF